MQNNEHGEVASMVSDLESDRVILHQGRLSNLIFPLVLVTLTLIPYWQTTHFGFVNFDDPSYVYENSLLRDGLHSERIRDAVFRFHEANWHPLVWLSYMAEIELFGMNPGVMHMTNVMLHCGNSLLLYLWLQRATGDATRSFLAGLIFALHPMHVESVAWITERKDVLSTLFLFATLIAYTEYVRRKSLAWYSAALVCFTIGLTSKGMLVTLPVVLLFFDIWPLRRFHTNNHGRHNLALVREVVVDKIPFLTLSLAVGVLTILAQRSGGTVAGIKALSLLSRMENSIVSYSRYLIFTVWPVRLCIFYPMPNGGWTFGVVIAAVFNFMAITLAVWRFRRQTPALLTGWFWYIFTLLPVIGIIQVGSQSIADRYMYVPMVGLSLMLLWAIPDRWLQYRLPVLTSLGVLSLLLLVLTTLQVAVWRDSVALFEHAITVARDDNFTSRSHLGIAYSDAGRYREAEQQFSLALELRPSDASCIANLGRNFNMTGEYARAGQMLTRALAVHPDEPLLWLQNGNAFRGLSDLASAVECYRRAVQLDSNSSEALNNLGLTLCRSDDPVLFSEGIGFIRQAIVADPENAHAHNSLGNALVQEGKLSDAAVSYREAIRLGNLEGARQNLRYVEEEMLRLKP